MYLKSQAGAFHKRLALIYTFPPELQAPKLTSSRCNRNFFRGKIKNRRAPPALCMGSAPIRRSIREKRQNLQKSRIEPVTMSIYDFLLNPESLDF